MSSPEPVSQVSVLTSSGASYLLDIDAAFQEYSAYATELVRNRRQWRNVEQTRNAIASDCKGFFSALSVFDCRGLSLPAHQTSRQ